MPSLIKVDDETNWSHHEPFFHVTQFKINRKYPKGRVIDIKMFGPRHTIPNAIPVLYLLNVYCTITFSFVNMSTYLRSVTDLPSK